MAAAETVTNIPWWKEPTKDQWLAWVAAWLGWTLDAFDFTIFLLIMLPIAQEFDVPLTAVTAVFTLTLWMRLLGATASGWLADRVGRKTPLMISILWYSICNFIAGFSPTFWFLFLFRALLGIGMGAEWPAGAALAMESWPARSPGFMSGGWQGAWGAVADKIGRRWAMIIPAAIGIVVTPFYLGFFTTSYVVLVAAFIVQGFFAGAVYGQNPSYLSERFPTEVRATASGFCYHQGAIWGGLVGPLLAAWAATMPDGFTMPMLIITVASEIVFIIALLLGPETKGKELGSELQLAHAPAASD